MPRGAWYLAFGVLVVTSAARAGVQLLVVVHVVRMAGTDDEDRAGIRRGGYSGAVATARDLDHF